jgi:hypothetical protein
MSTLSFTPPPPPPPGERGTGRLVIRYSTAKRGRGKPPLKDKLKRDRIVAYVEHLQRTSGRLISHDVAAAAEFFGLRDERTVWRAWREYRPVRVTSLPDVEWGPPTLIATVPAPNRRARLPAGVKWCKPHPFRFRF